MATFLLLLCPASLPAAPAFSADAVMEIAYSDVVRQAQSGNAATAVVAGHTISVVLRDGRRAQSYIPGTPDFVVGLLLQKDARVVGKPEEADANPLLRDILSWLPSALLWVIAFRFVGVKIKRSPDAGLPGRLGIVERRLLKPESTVRAVPDIPSP
jgi:hypothetical protein